MMETGPVFHMYGTSRDAFAGDKPCFSHRWIDLNPQEDDKPG
jgi:hypothetical protein